MVNNVKIKKWLLGKDSISGIAQHTWPFPGLTGVSRKTSLLNSWIPKSLRVLSHRKHKEAMAEKGLSPEDLCLWLLSGRANYVLPWQKPEDFRKYRVSWNWRAQGRHNMVRGLWTPQRLLEGRRLWKLLSHKHGFTAEGNQITSPQIRLFDMKTILSWGQLKSNKCRKSSLYLLLFLTKGRR